MRCFSACLRVALLSCLGTAPLAAGPISVDGSWADWGINPSSGDWQASTGQRIFFENYTSSDGTGFISPGWGGQFFDVEAMYAQHQGDSIAFAIVTGFDPDGVTYSGALYDPGDIFLSLGSGNPTWNIGIDLQTKNVYLNAAHSNPIDFPNSTPFTITGGTIVGAAELSMNSDGLRTIYHSGDTTSKHYLIEGKLNLALVNGVYQDVSMHWTMSCGNDVGEGSVQAPPAPEPATIALFSIGAAAAAAARRKIRPKR